MTLNRNRSQLRGVGKILAYLFLLSAPRLGKFTADHRARDRSEHLALSVGI